MSSLCCPNGHPYDGDNVYVTPSGQNRCRTCNRESAHRRRQNGRPVKLTVTVPDLPNAACRNDPLFDRRDEMQQLAICRSCAEIFACYHHARKNREVGTWGGHVFPDRGQTGPIRLLGKGAA